jgi:membrane dipeptidase
VAGAAEPDDALVKRVHASAITVDPHIDILDDFDAKRAATETTEQFDLPKLERGDLDVATIALFANPAATTPENVSAARKEVDKKLKGLQQLVADHNDRLEIARSAADIERIAKADKHAILLSFLNALPLGEDLALLRKYHQEGVRVFGFVHASNNAFADSSRPNAAFGDKPNEHGGLTDLGKRAIAELNRLGIVIDVSQLTPSGVLQTVQLSSAPVIASHSGLRSRVDVPRNLMTVAGLAWLQLATLSEVTHEITQNWLPSVSRVNQMNTATSDFRVLEFQHVVNTDETVMSGSEFQEF